MTAAGPWGNSRRPLQIARSWSSMRCCLLLLILPSLSSQTAYFKKLFADAGIAIHCPSDNKVYIHPISGDLQQCSQQLGNYNESSCPEGTVCERFPILIPGFQDYCCWADGQTTDNENLIIGTTTEVPDELMPFTEAPPVKPMRKLVVTAAPERPEEEEDNGNGNMSNEDYEEATTKRPRNRKTTTTTTTEEPTTTTKKPSNRRLPRCQNPDDMPLIDFGNRLRDCYYQQCIRGYRCEFNKDIRRFICCGSAAVVIQPVGLPVIPQPKPLIPRPPNRRGPFNFNDGDEEETGCPYDNQNGCKMTKVTQPPSNNWSDNNCPYGSKTSTGCPYGPTTRPNTNSIQDGCSGNAMSGCGAKGSWNQNSNNIEQQQLPPPAHIPEPQPLSKARPQENGYSNNNWNDYDNPYESGMNRGNEGSQRGQGGTGSWNGGQGNNMQPQSSGGNSGWNSGPSNEQNWNGGNGANSWGDQQNSGNWQGGSTNQPSNNGGSGWNGGYNSAPPPSQPQQERGNWKTGSSSPQEMGNNWEQNGNWNGGSQGQQMGGNWNGSPAPRRGNGGGESNWNSQQGGNMENGEWRQNGDWGNNEMPNTNQNWQGNSGSGGNQQATMRPGNMNGGMKNDYDDYDDNFQQNKNWGNDGMSTGQPKPFNNWNNGNVGSNKRSRPAPPNMNTCQAGSEFRQQGAAPKCIPPGADACPLSHPRCLPSPSLGHNVCCL